MVLHHAITHMSPLVWWCFLPLSKTNRLYYFYRVFMKLQKHKKRGLVTRPVRRQCCPGPRCQAPPEEPLLSYHRSPSHGNTSRYILVTSGLFLEIPVLKPSIDEVSLNARRVLGWRNSPHEHILFRLHRGTLTYIYLPTPKI